MSHTPDEASPKPAFSRRGALKRLAVGAAVLAAGSSAHAAPPTAPRSRKRLLRVAHLTDIHVQPELKAAEGLAACLRHVQSQPDRPDLIVNTGDCIMDSMKRDRARTDLQWDVWRRVWKSENSLPVEHAIGNHDIWGWNRKKSGATGNEGNWGKQSAMEKLGLSKAYRSFGRGGWHFVALDSVQPFEDGYTARLDDEQFAWLQSDLAAVDPTTPVFVLSHVPILSMTTLMEPKADSGATPADPTQINRGSMHADYRRIKDLFKAHPNVKCAVSGHIHLIDRVEYLGVTYFCDGAVSGNWWKGSRFGEAEPGYAMINLYDDGTVERDYVAYGWTPAPAAQASLDD